MKRICILGSTGSIGTQTLDIARHYNTDLEVISLSAASSVDKMEAQIREFSPKKVCMYDSQSAHVLREKIKDTDAVSRLYDANHSFSSSSSESSKFLARFPASRNE